MAPFLDLDNLKPFVDKDLADSTKPVVFNVPSGSKAYGYKAELLPKVCEVYLTARDENKLLKSQEKMAKACEILMRALAHVGIVALVDEATGYQYDRSRRALEEILETYIKDELGKWAKRFPDEFYSELFRLKGLKWPSQKNPPQYVGHCTNNLGYKRGHRANRFHQWLTDDVGQPGRKYHLTSS